MAKTTTTEARLKAYLDSRAEADKEFAKRYADPGKSLEECWRYICQEVQKRMSEGLKTDKGTMLVVDDEEVFGMAVHYYDEAGLKVAGPVGRVATATAEDKPKAKARPKARRKEEKVLADDSQLDIPLFE